MIASRVRGTVVGHIDAPLRVEMMTDQPGAM